MTKRLHHNKTKTSCCKRSYLPNEVRMPLLLEVGFRCPIPVPDCAGFNKTILEFHHIEPWAYCHQHDPNKMIAICPTCHSRLDRGEIDRDIILKIKQELKLENNPNYTKGFVNNEPNALIRLSREGELQNLYRELTAIDNYCKRSNLNNPFIRNLTFERLRVLRKLGKTTFAQRILARENQTKDIRLSFEERLKLNLAKAYLEFNALSFSAASQHLKTARNVITDVSSAEHEVNLFQIDWRLAICSWYGNASYTDLEQLDNLSMTSNFANDRATYLLARAAIEKNSLPPNWVREVEEMFVSLENIISLPSHGYEKHTIAELSHLASQVFESRGKKASSRKIAVWRDKYFSRIGAAVHSKVYEFNTRKLIT
jgi:hypothetical protein